MKALIDHIECGGGGCRGCGWSGTEVVECITPLATFVVRGDDDGFEADREHCPCYQGIKINDGVVQCTHRDSSASENWCAPDTCPLIAALAAQQQENGNGE